MVKRDERSELADCGRVIDRDQVDWGFGRCESVSRTMVVLLDHVSIFAELIPNPCGVCSSRLSLPASLLEPIPNLEYWHYADRPDIFAR